nr:hypothetical protein CFP56_66295 [Quercus suber]
MKEVSIGHEHGQVGDRGLAVSLGKFTAEHSLMSKTTHTTPHHTYLETGSEPSPIDCFKKFHTKKDGKEWATDKAKTLHDGSRDEEDNSNNDKEVENSLEGDSQED